VVALSAIAPTARAAGQDGHLLLQTPDLKETAIVFVFAGAL